MEKNIKEKIMEITKQAYSEVYAIINLLSWNLFSKIPDKILENIE